MANQRHVLSVVVSSLACLTGCELGRISAKSMKSSSTSELAGKSLRVQPQVASPAAGDCVEVLLTLLDSAGSLATVSSSLSLYFSTTGAVVLHSNSGCSANSTISELTLLEGTSSARIYARDTKAESANLSVSVPGLSPTTVTFSVFPGYPASISFLSPLPATGTAGIALTPAPRVVTLDAYGNRATEVTSIILGAYLDSDCLGTSTTALAGQSASTLSGVAQFASFTATRAQTIWIKASAGALSACTPSSIVIGPGPAAVPNSTLAIDVSTIPTRAPLTATLTLQDTYGNPIAGVRPVFTVSGASANELSSSAPTDASGVTTLTFTSSIAGPRTLSVSSPSSVSSLSQSFSVVAPPVGLAFSVNPATYQRGGQISPNVISAGTGGAATSFALASGSPPLPAGLTLDSATGALEGTPLAPLPATNYSIIASNSGGSQPIPLVLRVNDLAPTGLAYLQNPAAYTYGKPVSNAASTTGGGTVISYQVSPSLPPGLNLNTSTGLISGTPLSVVSQATYTVTAFSLGNQATISVPISVAAPKLVLTGPSAVQVGSCSNAIQITIRDAQGAVFAPGAMIALTPIGLGSAKLYSTQDCTGSPLGNSIPFGTSTLSLRLRDMTEETVNLAFSSAVASSNILSTVVADTVPKITSITPSIGPTTGNTVLTITGEKFSTSGTGSISPLSVQIGPQACKNVVFNSPTSITCTTPLSSSTGSFDVKVTNSNLQSVTAAAGFQYTVPVPGQFVPAGNATFRRSAHKTIALANGSVLIYGGYNTATASGSYPPPEIYEPSAGRFLSLGYALDPPIGISNFAAPLSDGKIAIFSPRKIVRIHDGSRNPSFIAANPFSYGNAPYPADPSNPANAPYVTPDGTLGVIETSGGAMGLGWTYLNGHFKFSYDEFSGQISVTPFTFVTSVSPCTNPQILSVGRLTAGQAMGTYRCGNLASVFPFVYAGGAFHFPQDNDSATGVQTLFALFDLTGGGRLSYVAYDSGANQLRLQALMRWSGAGGAAPQGAGAAIPGSRYLTAGGHTSSTSAVPVATGSIFDPGSGTQVPTGSMALPRREHTMTLLPNGRVLVLGGWSCDGNFGCDLDSAELYIP